MEIPNFLVVLATTLKEDILRPKISSYFSVAELLALKYNLLRQHH